MATKNIVKFLLRLVVAAAIIVGAVFLVSALTSKRDSEVILKASIKNEISVKYKSAYEGLLAKTETNTVKYIMISSCNKINDVLVEYYDYYLNMTSFEHKQNDSKRDQIVKKIEKLSTKIDDTSQSVKLLNTSGLGQNEYNLRWINATNNLVDQTKLMFEIDDLLQEYVYETNYQLTSTGIVNEAQLEMMKDYAKVAFDRNIANNVTEQESPTILVANEETSFAKVINKFFNRQKKNTNGSVETNFASEYMNIDLSLLTPFYAFNESEKQAYIASIEDVTERNLVDRVFQYMAQSSF